MGAIGAAYAELEDLKNILGLEADDTEQDATLTMALSAASTEVTNHTGRQFNRAEVATPRLYYPVGPSLVLVDDFWTTDDLIIKIGSLGGSFGTAWADNQYELFPTNGLFNGAPGVYDSIKVQSYGGLSRTQDRVQVTAKWGWPEVPAPVRMATLMLAEMSFKVVKEAPLGVVGFKNFASAKVTDNPVARSMLCDYVSVRGQA